MSETDLLLTRANTLYVTGDLSGCADICEQILELDSVHAGALHLTGRLADRAGNAELAAAYFGRAAATEPHETRHPFAQAAALRQLDRTPEAITALKSALALNPDFHAAHFNLANALKDENQLTEAMVHYQTAVELAPGNADYLANLAAAHRELEQLDDALTTIGRALEIKPDDGILKWNRAQLLLMNGDFAAGWDAYPARFESGPKAFRRRHQDRPEWDGGDLSDGKLLLWGDHGLGDEMITGSLVNEARERVPNIILECEPRLVPIFARSFSDIEVVPRRDPPDDRTAGSAIVAQMALGDLPRLLRCTLADFKPSPGYLKPDAEQARAARERLVGLGKKPRIGISWESANPFYKPRVDVPLALWDDVLRIDDVAFVSVQYGDTDTAINDAMSRTGTTIHRDQATDLWSDIDGTAALLSNIDLLIAASNSTACLAAALGVPVWQLLPTAPEFYWGMSSERDLWFDRMRLVRQTERGNWAELMNRVARDLADWVAKR